MNNLHICLINPEIPQNTGNIARLAAATGCRLILAGTLGFSLEDKYLKRAGMDYWQHVSWEHIPDAETFADRISDAPKAFISTKASRRYTEIAPEFLKTCGGGEPLPFYLVFGNESSGLPPAWYTRFSAELFRIPMREGLRSLNLSSSAALVAYHLLEQAGFAGLV